jgi:SAM-dependent methyltransferase
MRCFFEEHGMTPRGFSLAYRKALAHEYRRLIPDNASVLEIGCGDGTLLEMLPGAVKAGIDASARQIERARARLPGADFEMCAAESFLPKRTYDYIVVSDTLNFAADCQLLLERLTAAAHRDTRLLINIYNPLWNPILSTAGACGAISPSPVLNWLSRSDVLNFLQLGGWESIGDVRRILLPFANPLARLVNRWLTPFLPVFALTNFTIARLAQPASLEDTSVSIIIPARNESGNIEAAILRTPRLAEAQEIIFIEGGSKDDTWAAIEAVRAKYPNLKIKAARQTKRGKANAVWEGFDLAEGNILMILDADLTMPPEELPKFYRALVGGQAELANGVRLVYPMDNKAMPFLNLCANHFFAKLFTWVLNQPVKDTLCGTKVLTRAHYRRIAENRKIFGDFDPFGDFDLLFGAARMQLKITDIPIRYRERSYGETNISRWRHGAILLRMALIGARRLKFC